MDAGRSGQQAVLGDEADHRLVQEDQARLLAGIVGQLVRQMREAMVEQAVQPLLREVADLGERDRERIELEAERLGMEVAARIQPVRLLALGLEEGGLSVTARSSRAICSPVWSRRSSAAPWT